MLYTKTIKVRKGLIKMKNTALSATKQSISFNNESHREFYEKWMPKCRYQDVYHKALVVLQRMALPFLEISEDTRNHAEEIYDWISSNTITAVPKTAVKSLSELSKDGFYIKDAMLESQMVLSDNLADKDEMMDKYLSGYGATSFAAESFDDGVNGSLRKGAIVSVYVVDPATEMLMLMADNVYIANVYDSSGNKISEDCEIATSHLRYM